MLPRFRIVYSVSALFDLGYQSVLMATYRPPPVNKCGIELRGSIITATFDQWREITPILDSKRSKIPD